MAEFDPSADHNVAVSGTPVVDHYEIGFYLVGAAQPLQVNQLGKPNPDADGRIRVGLGAHPLPGVLYEARVSALGPGGAGVSGVSNSFTFSATPCSYVPTPPTQTVAASGGMASVAVATAGGCTWTATEGLSWVTITGGSSGTGNGTVSLTVSPNTSASTRTGTLTVAGQMVSLTQTACSYSATPATLTVAAGGGTASVAVATANGCTWTATESLSWVTITGGGGTGNGAVSLTVSANTSTSARTGTLTVAGRTITITQEIDLPAPANLRIVSNFGKALWAPSGPPPSVRAVERSGRDKRWGTLDEDRLGQRPTSPSTGLLALA